MISVLRYLFIHDAKVDSAPLIESAVRQLKEIDRGVEYDFYAAKDREDALRHVSLYCDLHPDLDTCIVACGNDDLTSAVASGLMGAGEGKSLAIFDPEGTNSLARNYEGRSFGSIHALMEGRTKGLDMIRVNDSYAVNACTFGLEDMVDSKSPGLMQSLSAVLKRSFRSVRITADGSLLDAGSVLLMALSNGRYSSGGLLHIPKAVNDDGKMDLCIVRNMPPTRMVKILPSFLEGRLDEVPSLASDLIIREAKSVRIESSKDITLSVDGHLLTGREFDVRLVPSAIRMTVPAE